MRSLLFSGVLFLGALLLLTGCDTAEPDVETVPGTYQTVTFLADIEGEIVDVMAAGGLIEMTLADDGTVSGRFLVPEALAGDDGENLTYDLAGTYTVVGDAVTFTQDADTFIRDVTWTFDDGALRLADENFDIVLRKQ